jgi:hypothetical protein
MRAKPHVGVYVKHPLLLSTSNENWNALKNFSETSEYHTIRKSIRQILVELPNIKLHEHRFRVTRLACGWLD